nr:uncharacterized protein LOC109151877 [Ipomoea trifida]
MLTAWRKGARVSFCRCHARRSALLDCRCVAKETEGRLSAEDFANRPLCAAARNVARRKRPKLPMLWSSAEWRRTPETSGPPRCSAAVHGRGRRKRRVRWPTPLLCFFELLQRRGTPRRRPCEEFRSDVFEHGDAFTTESRHRRTEEVASSSSPVTRSSPKKEVRTCRYPRLAKDEQGNWLKGFTYGIGDCPAETAEAWALLRGIGEWRISPADFWQNLLEPKRALHYLTTL